MSKRENVLKRVLAVALALVMIFSFDTLSASVTFDTPVDQTTERANEPAVIEGQGDPTSDPVSDPTSDPVSDPTSDPVSDPVSDPTGDPIEVPGEELQEQSIRAQIYADQTYAALAFDGASITVSGNLPQGATVKAYPVSISAQALGLDGETEEVFVAYDITIFDANGGEYQPDDTVSVKIDTPELANIEQNGVVNVYHVGDAGPQTVAVTAQDGEAVEFEADGFSVYAITINYNRDNITVTVKDEGTQAGYTVPVTQQSYDNKTKKYTYSGTLILHTNQEVAAFKLGDVRVFGAGSTSKLTKESYKDGMITLEFTRRSLGITYTYTINIKVMSKEALKDFPAGTSYTFGHIDVKTAAAITEGFDTGVTVKKLLSVSYYDANQTKKLDPISGYFNTPADTALASAEWSSKNQSSVSVNSLTDSIAISVELSDGTTLNSTLTKDAKYPVGTKYNGDGKEKLKTYLGVDPDKNGYYDISDMSIFLVSAIACNGSSVERGKLTKTDGLDLVLNVGTLITTDYSLHLSGTKMIVGDDSLEGDDFSFLLIETDEDWKELLDSHGDYQLSRLAKNNADGKFNFDTIEYVELPIPQDGDKNHVTKYYIVKEEIPIPVKEYISYSDWTYYVTVVVTIDSEGNSSAAVSCKYSTSENPDLAEAESIEFTNYAYLGSLEITKDVVNKANDTTPYDVVLQINEEPYSGSYYIRDAKGTVPGSTSDGHISFKDGETIVIKGLTHNMDYKLNEVVPVGADFTPTYAGTNGTAIEVGEDLNQRTGTIPESPTPQTITITNTYKTYEASFDKKVVDSLGTTVIEDDDEQPDDVSNKPIYQVGEKVYFKLESTYPLASQADTATYTFKDKLPTGLKLNDDVALYVNNVKVDHDTPDTAGNKFELKAVFADEALKGKEIYVLYSATVTNEVQYENTNEASLAIPGKATQSDAETVYSAGIQIKKIDSAKVNGQIKPLSGARFKVFTGSLENRTYLKFTWGTARYVYHSIASSSSDADTELVTGVDGIIKLFGLKEGTYYVEETQAPTGYITPSAANNNNITTVVITKDSISTTQGYQEVEIMNRTSVALPQAGGTGTKRSPVLPLGGALLLSSALFLLANKKRIFGR